MFPSEIAQLRPSSSSAESEKPYIQLTVVGWLEGMSYAVDSLYSFGKEMIAHEGPTINNSTFLSQESGMSFMDPKSHI